MRNALREDRMGNLAPGASILLIQTEKPQGKQHIFYVSSSSESHVSHATSVCSYFIKYIYLQLFSSILIIQQHSKTLWSEIFLFKKKISKFSRKPSKIGC